MSKQMKSVDFLQNSSSPHCKKVAASLHVWLLSLSSAALPIVARAARCRRTSLR